LVCGDERLPLRVVASREEHRIVTSNPAELQDEEMA
jgi:hypothetical protein